MNEQSQLELVAKAPSGEVRAPHVGVGFVCDEELGVRPERSRVGEEARFGLIEAEHAGTLDADSERPQRRRSAHSLHAHTTAKRCL